MSRTPPPRHIPDYAYVDLQAPSAALLTLTNLWILRGLAPLRGYFSWLESDGFDVSSRCFTTAEGFNDWGKSGAKRLNRRAVVQQLCQLHPRAEKNVATVRLRKALGANCSRIAGLSGWWSLRAPSPPSQAGVAVIARVLVSAWPMCTCVQVEARTRSTDYSGPGRYRGRDAASVAALRTEYDLKPDRQQWPIGFVSTP